MKIVIAEDDEFLTDNYRFKLEKEGHTVFVGKNGEEGMHLIHEHQPDLILLDINMPKKDGFETLKEIRETEGFEKTPIIMLSNLNEDADVHKAMDLGATDYFIKTETKISDLVEIVKKHE